MARPLSLPDWAAVEDDTILIDPALAYPALLTERGLDPAEVTQYDLEVAYQMAKMDIQVACRGTKFLEHAKALKIRILNRPEWALAKFPRGRGIEAATQGKEARRIYQELRGYMP